MLQEKHERRAELRNYFLSALDENGGFRGRKGKGDIYYSAFALRGLFLLGMLNNEYLGDETMMMRFRHFLEQQRNRNNLLPSEILSWTFCVSLLQSVQDKGILPDEADDLLHIWERFRHSDNCFVSSAQSAFSSTYTTFLSAIFYELLGKSELCLSLPVGTILERQRPDGGFVELPPLRHSGVNPTAAAVGLLTLLEEPFPHKSKIVDFLCQCQRASGGFQAHARVPLADLLSSFSAVTALYDLGADDQIDQPALRDFVASLRSSDGGFVGVSLDRQSDVEYTFYGMILESMLSHH